MLFGLFSRKPPLPVREKAWTEYRMRWLARHFGIDRLLKAEVVVPDDRWFPEPYDATPAYARRLMDRIGSFMHIDASPIQLDICEDDAMPGAAGQYEPGVIRLAESELATPPTLVAVLAHELAHHELIGRGLLHDDLDHEWVTDLLPVYLGVGIFAANATLQMQSGHAGHHSWWTMRRRGYLSSCMIGYALALFAWVRDERKPEWAEHLRLDAAHTLAAGLPYLMATEDSLFDPATCRSADHPISWQALLEQIEQGSPSASMAALWELAYRAGQGGTELWQAVAPVRSLMSAKLPALRAEAARALASFGQAAEPALEDLIQLLDDASDEVRGAAAYALGRLAMQPETAVPRLAETLDNQDLVLPAAVAIAAFGPAARAAMPSLALALTKALGETNYGDVDGLVCAIEATAADPAAELRQVLTDCDAEFRPQAEQMLAHHRPVPTGAGAPGAWFGDWCRRK
jgi:hypothetical protein